MRQLWIAYGILGPPLFLVVGIWVGRRITEEQAVERHRKRLKKRQAAGQQAARAQAILDGTVARVRRAKITSDRKRGKHF